MTDIAKDLNIVVSMYNLLECSDNYAMTSGSLLNYYRDKINDVDDNASQGKSFKYMSKMIGNAPAQPSQHGHLGHADWPVQPPVPSLNIEVSIPFKYLSNFWRSFNLSLINCEVELDLSPTKDGVLTEHHNNIIGVN